MSQSRTLSFVEALTNVTVGLLIALATQVILFRLLGIEVITEQTLIIAAVFTAVSVLRSYVVRRLFERLRSRRRMPA